MGETVTAVSTYPTKLPEDTDPRMGRHYRTGPHGATSTDSLPALDREELYSGSENNPFLAAARELDPDFVPRAKYDYLDDPVAFVHDCFLWEGNKKPTTYQDEILSLLVSHRRVSVRGPHGLGKTALASWAILWFAITRDMARIDWKCPTTASTWRQLENYLWPEIRKWSRFLNWEKIGREPFISNIEQLNTSLKLGFGTAFATASDSPENIEGAHADHLFYMMDESKTIPAETFDAIEGAFSGGGPETGMVALALSISTPGNPSGRFYDIQTRRSGTEDWKVRAVSLEEAIEAGRVSREWADNRGRQWGLESTVFKNRVLGEFATDDVAGVIPLTWLNQAQERWVTKEAEQTLKDGGFTCIGVDVGYSGSDPSVIAVRYYDTIIEMRKQTEKDTMRLSGVALGIIQSQGFNGYAAVDVVGVGAGTVDRLREQGVDVWAFHANEGTEQVDISGELGFANQRSAAWWTLRELLDPANDFNIALPEDDALTGELTSPRWWITSTGRIQVERKEQVRKRIGRSTDYADAVVMAFAVRPMQPLSGILIYDDPVVISPF